MRFFHWRIAAKSKTHYYVGRAYGRTVNIYDKFEIRPLPRNTISTKSNERSQIYRPLYRSLQFIIGKYRS